MEELELIATFDTAQTAREVSEGLNAWFTWMSETDSDENKMEEYFADYGVSVDEFAIDKEDMDWDEPPTAKVRGNRVIVSFDSMGGMETVKELLEALGAYDVTQSDE